MTNRPPNIIVFMDDQEQAQVCLPDHPCKKPYVDRLIREGLQFTRAYTPTAHSCPARAAYFTGTYPSQNKVYNNVLNAPKINGTYDPLLTHFSQVLRQVGWNHREMACFGHGKSRGSRLGGGGPDSHEEHFYGTNLEELGRLGEGTLG